MKPFFGKQIIERPRWGSSNRSLKMRSIGRINDDGDYEGPSRVPMSMRAVEKYSSHLQSKGFTDVLGPIERYLNTKIGHKWDKVFSELSEALGSGSYPVRHVLRDHILNRRSFGCRVDGPLMFRARDGIFYVDQKGFVRKQKR